MTCASWGMGDSFGEGNIPSEGKDGLSVEARISIAQCYMGTWPRMILTSRVTRLCAPDNRLSRDSGMLHHGGRGTCAIQVCYRAQQAGRQVARAAPRLTIACG